jgi:hypothetical protein
MDAIPENERHLKLHDLHLIGVSGHDRPLITGNSCAPRGPPHGRRWQARLRELEAAGATDRLSARGPRHPGSSAGC